MKAWRIDPSTGEAERLPSRGRKVRREPASASVQHLLFDWFPLRVTPGKERLARLLLEDRGIVTFCPMEVKWRNANRYTRAKNAKRQIAYPWHPGLLFVAFRRDDEPRGCSRCSGRGTIQKSREDENGVLVSFIGSCGACGGSGKGRRLGYAWHLIDVEPVRSVISATQGEPHRMRHDAIWRLMERFGEGRFIRPEEQRYMASGREFGVGDEVRITDGVMEGRTFRVQAISGSMATLFGKWFGSDLGFDAPLRILVKED